MKYLNIPCSIENSPKLDKDFLRCGAGGDRIIETCNRVLRQEYPCLADKIAVILPDEKTHRVGQPAAAASLPELSSEESNLR